MRPVFILALITMYGCTHPTPTLRIGTKNFIEQHILTEMTAQLLREQSDFSATIIACGDTYTCERALQERDIDILIEYSGTGLSFFGEQNDSTQENAAAIKRARAIYAQRGITWLDPLGFDNRYVLLARSDRAASLKLSQISDLNTLTGGIRIVTPREYLRRPIDGMASLIRRYGLQLAAEPLIVDDISERLKAVLDGRADVTIAYATDGASLGMGLLQLSDDLHFFPPYEGTLLIQTHLLEKYPTLRTILQTLSNTLSTASMQRLNYSVQVEGYSPTDVAQEFLLKNHLSHNTETHHRWEPEIELSYDKNSHSEHASTEAVRLLRQAFPGRPVHMKSTLDVAQSLRDGKSWLGILSASDFFKTFSNTAVTPNVEAVAVLGMQLMHVVYKKRNSQNDTLPTQLQTPPSLFSMKHLCTEPRSTHSGHTAQAFLAHLKIAQTQAPCAEPLQILAKHLAAATTVDGALIVAESGSPELREVLLKYHLQIAPLLIDSTTTILPPYFRPARIPAGTYPDTPEPIDTVGTQIVLVAPAHKAGTELAIGGHAASISLGNRPLLSSEIEAIVQAAPLPEPPDPLLPSAWANATFKQNSTATEHPLRDALLNFTMMGFLGWLVWVVVKV